MRIHNIAKTEMRNHRRGLHKAIFSQNNNKTLGTDKLVSEIFKSCYDILSPFLLKLYNRMLNNSEYPLSWGGRYNYAGFNKKVITKLLRITVVSL